MIWYDLHNKVMMKTNYIWSKETYYLGEKRVEEKKKWKMGEEKKINKEKHYTALLIVIMICKW